MEGNPQNCIDGISRLYRFPRLMAMCHPSGVPDFMTSQPLRAGLPSGRASRRLGRGRGEGNGRPKFLEQAADLPTGFSRVSQIPATVVRTMCHPSGVPDFIHFPSPCGLGYRLVAPTALGAWKGRVQRRPKLFEGKQFPRISRFCRFRLQCATPPGFLILYRFFPSPCGLGYRLVAPSRAWGNGMILGVVAPPGVYLAESNGLKVARLNFPKKTEIQIYTRQRC